ncbi:PAS domain S-box protein [Polyangium aurulentum]|uniref:PAS domain S-box protein n=1 Tax=Polyangium aurulentum TaxID=2567896 RepID=UPI0010AEDA51|nr:PAS domain S-box protein [Polyangium aurulentum]UQA56287.1 PAS domain S-box protein [Polyangium aurulentum]
MSDSPPPSGRGTRHPADPTAQKAAAEAEAQRRRLHELFMQAPAGIALLRGPELVFELANPPYERMFHKRDLVGKRVRDAFPEIQDPEVFEGLERIYATGEPVHVKEYRLRFDRRSDGAADDGFFALDIQAMRGPDGAIHGLMVVAIEISEQVRALRAAEAARERFALLAQVSAVMGTARDHESRLSELVRLLVPALCDASTLSIVTPSGAVQRLADAAVTPELADKITRARSKPLPAGMMPFLEEIFRSGKSRYLRDYRTEIIAKLPQDEPYVAALRHIDYGAVVFAPLCVQGRVLGYLTLIMVDSGRDFSPEDIALIDAIAERAALAIDSAGLLREAERQRARLQEAFEQAPASICIMRGPDHVFELANAVCVRDLGGRRLLGRPLREALPEVVSNGFLRMVDRVYETGRTQHGVEVPFAVDRGGDGRLETAYHDFIYQPMRGPAGEVDGIICLAFDVTDRVLARKREAVLAEEVRRSEERFRVAFEHAAVGVALVGTDGRWIYANQKLQEILGYTLDELRASPFLDMTHPDDVEASKQNIQRLLSGEVSSSTHEKRYIRKDGRVVWTNISSAVGRRATGEPDHFVTIIEDISARKAAEAERGLFQALVETSGDFIGFATPEGQILYINSAGRALVGLGTQEQARTRTMADYLAPESLGAGSEAMRAGVLRGGTWSGEALYRNLETGEVIPVHKTSIAIRGEGGAPLVAIVSRDLRVQKRLEAERQRLLAREREARAAAEEANELKDRFLATVSHELRTPLNAMLGWMRMLRSGQLPPERRERALETVERNAKVQAQLVEDLLDISRMMSGKLRIEVHPLELMGVVEAAIETVRPAADAKRIELSPELGGGGGASILGDAARLQQVIWNLLNNAIKFTPKGGRVQIQVERAGASVEIAVKDTGQGIAPEFLPHVFEPFRQADGSTTRMHGGLGLGLAIVKSLVELHGGTIRALSEGAGKGATFIVRLPLAPARETRVESRAAQPMNLEASEMECPTEIHGLRVVVVDDEADARELLATLLERCGAEVKAAASVAEALEAVNSMRPDLVVADIGMPGEDGYGLIRKIRARSPEDGGRTPVVALTAYARSEDRTRALRAGFNMHVPKPIDAAELLAVIASIVPPRRAAG